MLRRILSKCFFCPEYDLDNVLIHIPLGILNVGLALLSGWVALIFGYGFVRYELNEQRALQDKAYQDIKGWLWGMGIMSVALLIKGMV